MSYANNSLHISLGHNSSAIYVEGDRVVRGYEQERIDEIKSSSAYPMQAISAALNGVEQVDTAFVGHWFDKFSLESNKYLNIDHLRKIAKSIVTLNLDFTHHDAHAHSALTFYESNGGRLEDSYVVVLDGFGSLQECFSFYEYRADVNRLALQHRTYGYAQSLGLMYQYVTEYLGMRPNQDEYKLLGYESHVLSYIDKDELVTLSRLVRRQAREHASSMLDHNTYVFPNLDVGDLIDKDALSIAKVKWTAIAHNWWRLFPRARGPLAKRAVVAYCAQLFIETATIELIKDLTGNRARPIFLSGGCFYNVKLNRKIQVATRNRVFANPLAGDQGASFCHQHVALHGFDLKWGHRSAEDLPASYMGDALGLRYVEEDQWVDVVAGLVNEGKIVNVMRGAMEFGPRALCNTTTFALPTLSNVSWINALNDRDEAMPMAPVMTRSAALRLLNHDELLDVPISDRYMITTVAFDKKPDHSMMGVAHKDPIDDIWTARPQVVDDGPLHDLLSRTPNQTLINTSFNYHGKPIAMLASDAVRTHYKQRRRALTLGLQEPHTLIVR